MDQPRIGRSHAFNQTPRTLWAGPSPLSRLQSSVALAISGQMIWTHSTVVEKGVDGHELDEVPRSEAHANRGAGSLNGWTVLSDGRVEGRETRRLTPLLGWSPTKWRTRASPFGTLPRRWTFRSSTPPSWRSRPRDACRRRGTDPLRSTEDKGQRQVRAGALVRVRGAGRSRSCRRRARRPRVPVTGRSSHQTGPLPTKVLEPAVRGAWLAPLRIHDLRHTAVSLWIADGAHPKQVAALAGHSSVSVVLDRYGHLYPSHDDDLIVRLERRGR